MEMEVDHRPVVSADGTAAAGLLDEYSLDALVATGDRFTNATLTPDSAVAVAVVFRCAGTHARMPCCQVLEGGRP
jgi:hypothetical protein